MQFMGGREARGGGMAIYRLWWCARGDLIPKHISIYYGSLPLGQTLFLLHFIMLFIHTNEMF